MSDINAFQNLSKTDTSLRRTLSSVPRDVRLERFYCISSDCSELNQSWLTYENILSQSPLKLEFKIINVPSDSGSILDSMEKFFKPTRLDKKLDFFKIDYILNRYFEDNASRINKLQNLYESSSTFNKIFSRHSLSLIYLKVKHSNFSVLDSKFPTTTS